MTYQTFKALLRKALNNNEPLCITIQLDNPRLSSIIQAYSRYINQFIFDENVLGSIAMTERIVESLATSNTRKHEVQLLTFYYNVSDE